MDFQSLLKLMKERRASDLFISAGIAPSIKVDGKIEPVSRNKLTAEQARDVVYRVMTPLQRANFERTSESNFAINLPDIGRFRVNVYRHQTQVGMVLRRIETEIPSLSELDLPEIMADMAMYRNGLLLVVGSTGAGKTTTLASMLHHRNVHSNGHIISIEDPIEFVHKPEGCIITQREVGIDTVSFEAALKNTLRQSPDLIVIGEIRTRETMQHALDFAETGHLVLATLHAANAVQALDRVVSFFPEDARSQILMDLSLNLRAIVAQRLVPKANETGRRVAVECLLNTPLVSSQIKRNEFHSIRDIMKKGVDIGMQTFDCALYELYKAGEISYDDALGHADSANDLRLMIKLGEQYHSSHPSQFDTISLVKG